MLPHLFVAYPIDAINGLCYTVFDKNILVVPSNLLVIVMQINAGPYILVGSKCRVPCFFGV